MHEFYARFKRRPLFLSDIVVLLICRGGQSVRTHEEERLAVLLGFKLAVEVVADVGAPALE